ncbi:unnamed protein product [Lactuca virosa]|uniref:Uncharacterized protein n=1 Tax=Lactuca virosa TaxID=75947 RepID=A0AAU9MEZ9_9ASTR|nr:unnamed protein product [Lactuca virosa]
MEVDEICQVEEQFESPLTVTRVERICLASTTNTYEQISDDENEGSGEDDEKTEQTERERGASLSISQTPILRFQELIRAVN